MLLHAQRGAAYCKPQAGLAPSGAPCKLPHTPAHARLLLLQTHALSSASFLPCSSHMNLGMVEAVRAREREKIAARAAQLKRLGSSPKDLPKKVWAAGGEA